MYTVQSLDILIFDSFLGIYFKIYHRTVDHDIMHRQIMIVLKCHEVLNLSNPLNPIAKIFYSRLVTEESK